MRFLTALLKNKKNMSSLLRKINILNMLLKKTYLFLNTSYKSLLLHVTIFRHISLEDDLISWKKYGDHQCALLHYHRRQACNLFHYIKLLKQEFDFLKSNPIFDFIEMGERPDGALKKDELIFYYSDKWFVITMDNLFKMEPIVLLQEHSGRRTKATLLNPDSQHIQFYVSLTFKFRMSKEEITVSCDTMVQHFGYDFIKNIFRLMKKSNIMQAVLNDVLYNIVFDTTKKSSKSMILVDPDLRIFFSVGTFNMCSVCCICVPKKKMEEHMNAHIKADRKQVLGNNPTIICCPICNTFLDKTNEPVEACNHLKCPLPSCRAAICYRCCGVRSIRGESELPPEKTFKVQSVRGALPSENTVEDEKTRFYAPYFWNYRMVKIFKSVPVCSQRCSAMHNLHHQLKMKKVLTRVVCCNGTDIHIEAPSVRNYSTEEQLVDMGMLPEEIEQLRQQQAIQDHLRNQVQRTAIIPQINMIGRDAELWRLFLQIDAQHPDTSSDDD